MAGTTYSPWALQYTFDSLAEMKRTEEKEIKDIVMRIDMKTKEMDEEAERERLKEDDRNEKKLRLDDSNRVAAFFFMYGFPRWITELIFAYTRNAKPDLTLFRTVGKTITARCIPSRLNTASWLKRERRRGYKGGHAPKIQRSIVPFGMIDTCTVHGTYILYFPQEKKPAVWRTKFPPVPKRPDHVVPKAKPLSLQLQDSDLAADCRANHKEKRGKGEKRRKKQARTHSDRSRTSKFIQQELNFKLEDYKTTRSGWIHRNSCRCVNCVRQRPDPARCHHVNYGICACCMQQSRHQDHCRCSDCPRRYRGYDTDSDYEYDSD